MLLLIIASQWLVKIACPQFKNSFVSTYKGFFFVVKKSEKPSHFQECFGAPGISDISFSSLSFVSVKGWHEIRTVCTYIKYFLFCPFSWLFSYSSGRKLRHAFDGCLTILNAKIHGSGDTTSAFVREKNYGWDSWHVLSKISNQHNEPSRYDINSRSLQRHFW